MITTASSLRPLVALLLAACLGSTGAAAEKQLPPSTSASRFSDLQREFVHNWIRTAAPGCPRDVAEAAALEFLEELRRTAPGDLERLMSPEFPLQKHQAKLLRWIGTQLTGPAHVTLREDVARRRIQAVLDQDATGNAARPIDAAAAIGKIKAMAPVYPRRLFEGRMDDDELSLLLRKLREPAGDAPAREPAKPRELTAADLVAEFARRNQDGAAAQRLRALAFEIEFTPASGESLEMFLFRLRPDRFRLVVRSGGTTRTITAYDGTGYWQLVPGQPARALPAAAIGELRHLREFLDPLLAESGFTFERLADGTSEGRNVYRIAVKRPDASGHVALIDQETFRHIGRETASKQLVRYSDFRAVGGVTLPHREEIFEADGKRSATVVIRRASADPGLVQALFATPESGSPDYFALEGMLAPARADAARSSAPLSR
jgi:hypothetical protein